MQKLRPYILPGMFVFHLVVLFVILATDARENKKSEDAVGFIIASQFCLTAFFAGLGPGPWALRIPSWGALAALSWISFVCYGMRLSMPMGWRAGVLPLALWVVLVAPLLLLRVIPFLKWRIALQPMPPDSQSRQPHKDSVTRGILIVVAAWAGVMIMVKDSWPWSEVVAELSGSSEHLFALGGAAALFGAGALPVAMLMVGLTLTRFADWLFYRRLWTLPLAATLLTGCAIVLLLSFGGPFKNGSERLLAGLWLLASLATQPLATLLVIGMAGYRLAPRQQPIPQNSEPSSPAATTVTEKPVANWLLRLQRAHFAALLGVLAFFVGYVPTGALDQHYLRINFGGTATGHLELRRWTTIDSFRAISKLDNLQSLDFTASRITDDDLVHLQGLTNLKTLLLSDKTTDAGLTHIRGFTNLQDLNLFGTQITDAGLVHLKEMSELEFLGLSATQITDAGLVHLKGLTNLQRLHIDGTNVTDAGLANLKGMTELQMLFLSDTGVTDAGLANLKGMTELEMLFLSDTGVTDVGLVHLKGLTGLTTLLLDNTQTIGAGLVHLQGMTRLRTLRLHNTQTTDASLVHLQMLPKLEALWLRNTRITDAGLVNFKQMEELKFLHLDGTNISDAGLVHLKGMPQLQFLGLTNTKLTNAGIVELQQALPKCEIHN